MITTYASGSQACTVTTEHDLSAPNVQGTYRLALDLNALVAGDVLEVRAYKMTVSGGTSRAHLFTAYYGAQTSFALVVEPFAELTNSLTDTNAIRYTIKQTFGTSRTIPWRVDKADALAPTTTGRTLAVSSGGVADANLVQILGTALTETAGQIAAAFKKFFDKASPTGSINSLPDAVAGASGGVALVGSNMGSASSVTAGVTVTTNNDKTGYGLSSAAVQAIWDAAASALTTVGSIGKWIVDKIDVVLSTRLASASYTAPLDAAGTRTAVGLASANLDTQLTSITTNQTTILDRIGAFTGSGVNTVLGFFKALLSKTATLPTDVGGTFDPATDSTEAIRDQGDAAWTGGGGGGGGATAAEIWSYGTRVLTGGGGGGGGGTSICLNGSWLKQMATMKLTMSKKSTNTLEFSIPGLPSQTTVVSAIFHIKTKLSDIDDDALVTKTVTTILASDGGVLNNGGSSDHTAKLRIIIDTNDLDALSYLRTYVFAIKCILNNGTVYSNERMTGIVKIKAAGVEAIT